MATVGARLYIVRSKFAFLFCDGDAQLARFQAVEDVVQTEFFHLPLCPIR